MLVSKRIAINIILKMTGECEEIHDLDLDGGFDLFQLKTYQVVWVIAAFCVIISCSTSGHLMVRY